MPFFGLSSTEGGDVKMRDGTLSSSDRFWIGKNDNDEIDESTLPLAHSLSLQKLNDKLNLANGPLSDDQKNQAFLAYIVNIDPSVQDSLRDIEKLHNNIVNIFISNSYFSKKKEYKHSLKTYITCRKKYYRQYKTNNEVQKQAMVQTVRESLATLRDCLLDMHFAYFAETEQGREMALLEEQASNIYQQATDDVRAKIDQQESLYADFLSNRNAFLLSWNIPEDNVEQETYTAQELYSIDHMKKSLQKYIDLSMQEVQKSYESSLDDDEVLERSFERFTETEQGKEIAQLEEQ
ncbi:MAG TPA: hypothetical protein VEP90_12980, partial [Methylomirabilota bacterium]|nr:hypothetical protein [Methylomirabilota bacterium]